MKRKFDLITAMRTFVTVVEQNSFSAASRELNLVTSAVSRQVSDLERHYNCQLLYRTTRSMHLTSEGHFYLERFTDLLARLERLESATQERQERISGHLRITTPLNMNQMGVHLQVADFARLHPGVKITLMMSNRYVNLVDEGIDLAMRVGALEDSTLIARHYGDLMIQMVASPDYLEREGVPSHPRELQQHTCLIDSSTELKGRWRYAEGKRLKHVDVDGPISLNSGALVAELAAQGHGIALLPNFMVRRYVESKRLVSILEDYQLPSAPISLVYAGNRLVNPALNALVDYLLENRPTLDSSAN